MDDIKFKPLDDDDVAMIANRIKAVDPTIMQAIYQTFANELNKMLSMAIKHSSDVSDLVELDRLKRILNLAPVEELFIRMKDKIWAVRKYIMEKNEDYFLKKDYSSAIKHDDKQVMIETLMDIVKDKFVSLSREDKEFYWDRGLRMLGGVAKFKKAIGES